MLSDGFTLALAVTLALFVVVECVVVWQVAKQARRERLRAADWLTQLAWSMVPVVLLAALLAVAVPRTGETAGPGASAVEGDGRP